MEGAGAMRIIGTIRSTETRQIEVEADSYDEGRRQVEAQVPEGWQLLSWRVDRSAPRVEAIDS